MSINKEGQHEEERFIRLVASRYPILRALYPGKTYPFMELSEHSGVDKSNLSGYIKTLDKEGVINITQKDEGGRTRSLISLELDTRRLLECVIQLRGERKDLTDLSNIEILDNNLKRLGDERIQRLVADQIQLISRSHKVPCSSKFFDFIRDEILEEKFRPVKSVLLLSLRNMVLHSDDDAKNRIREKVLETLQKISVDAPDDRAGIIAQDILNEFSWDTETYETLTEQYISEVEKGSERAPLIRRSIVERYPNQKTELRDRLIKLAVGADENLIKRVENEFNHLY